MGDPIKVSTGFNTTYEWMEFTPSQIGLKLDVVCKVTYNVQSVRQKKSIFSRECLPPTKKKFCSCFWFNEASRLSFSHYKTEHTKLMVHAIV